MAFIIRTCGGLGYGGAGFDAGHLRVLCDADVAQGVNLRAKNVSSAADVAGDGAASRAVVRCAHESGRYVTRQAGRGEWVRVWSMVAVLWWRMATWRRRG